MNAAIRSVVAVAITHGAEVWGIQNVRIWLPDKCSISFLNLLIAALTISISLDQGYSGLIAGGSMMRKLDWADIHPIIEKVCAFLLSRFHSI